MPKVTNLVQTRAGGIHVTMDNGGKVQREEAYFGFEITWLGKVQKVDVTADRYLARVWSDDNTSADQLTNWRVIVRSAYDSVLTDASRRAADEQIEPIVRAWIDGDEYQKARALAFGHAIRHVIADERFDSARARRVYDMHQHELTPRDAVRLRRACDALAELLDCLKDGE